MKPDWKDAPEWASWLALDEYGTWYWFELEPEWDSPGWDNKMGNYQYAGTQETPSQSMERRP